MAIGLRVAHCEGRAIDLHLVALLRAHWQIRSADQQHGLSGAHLNSGVRIESHMAGLIHALNRPLLPPAAVDDGLPHYVHHRAESKVGQVGEHQLRRTVANAWVVVFAARNLPINVLLVATGVTFLAVLSQ